MTLAIGLILVGVALPIVVGAIQNYRLNGIAQQTASLIDLARYTAIRRNMVISLQKASSTDLQNVNLSGTVLYVDVNGNGQLDANEPMLLIPSDMQISNGQTGTPDSTSMGFTGGTVDFTSSIAFDYRGVVVGFANGTSPAPYFLALAYTSQLQYGARAVTLTPMGQTKMWTAPNGGTWLGM